MRGHEARIFKSLLLILISVICGYIGTFAAANVITARFKVTLCKVTKTRVFLGNWLQIGCTSGPILRHSDQHLSCGKLHGVLRNQVSEELSFYWFERFIAAPSTVGYFETRSTYSVGEKSYFVERFRLLPSAVLLKSQKADFDVALGQSNWNIDIFSFHCAFLLYSLDI